MKRILLLTLAVLAFGTANAQKRREVFFLRNNLPVIDEDSADLIRIIEEPDSNSTLYNLYEYYKDGTRKTLGTLSNFEPALYYHGSLLSFYKNGKRKSTETYSDNQLTGKAFYYFENGKLERSTEYMKIAGFETLEHLNFLADSAGHVLVENGKGHVVNRIDPVNGWLEEGDYADGFKDGVWNAKSPLGDSSYTETFNHGRLVSGKSLIKGVSYKYSQIVEQPKCRSGMEAFYENVTRLLSNVKNLNLNHVYGKVYLSFVIQADGTLADRKVTRSLDPALDKLALRAINTGLKWLPGRAHGIPTAMLMNIPVGFSRPLKDGWPDYTAPGSAVLSQ